MRYVPSAEAFSVPDPPVPNVEASLFLHAFDTPIIVDDGLDYTSADRGIGTADEPINPDIRIVDPSSPLFAGQFEPFPEDESLVWTPGENTPFEIPAQNRISVIARGQDPDGFLEGIGPAVSVVTFIARNPRSFINQDQDAKKDGTRLNFRTTVKDAKNDQGETIKPNHRVTIYQRVQEFRVLLDVDKPNPLNKVPQETIMVPLDRFGVLKADPQPAEQRNGIKAIIPEAGRTRPQLCLEVFHGQRPLKDVTGTAPHFKARRPNAPSYFFFMVLNGDSNLVITQLITKNTYTRMKGTKVLNKWSQKENVLIDVRDIRPRIKLSEDDPKLVGEIDLPHDGDMKDGSTYTINTTNKKDVTLKTDDIFMSEWRFKTFVHINGTFGGGIRAIITWGYDTRSTVKADPADTTHLVTHIPTIITLPDKVVRADRDQLNQTSGEVPVIKTRTRENIQAFPDHKLDK